MVGRPQGALAAHSGTRSAQVKEGVSVPRHCAVASCDTWLVRRSVDMTGGRPETSNMSCEATRRAVEHSNAISATFVCMPIVNDPVAVPSASNRHMWIYWIALVQNTRHRQTTRHHYALPLQHAPGQSCLTKQSSATPMRALQPWFHHLLASRKGPLSIARM